jgi:hypothetical protein
MPSTRSRRRSTAQPDPGPEATARADAEVTTCPSTGLPPTARVLFAVVNADGALVRGLGAAVADRLATGMYQVVFDQDVTAAGYVGTLGLPGNAGVAPCGEVTVAGRTGIPNAVFVCTYAVDGTPTDRPFHLAVLT